MAKPRQSWGELPKEKRDKAAAQAAEQFGLTRRQARERYNRGTYKPFARNRVDRVPESSPRRSFDPSFYEQLKREAQRNFDRRWGDVSAYAYAGRTNVIDVIENEASTQALLLMARASDDEMKAWAEFQHYSDAPPWLQREGWYDSDHNWHNVFWYH